MTQPEKLRKGVAEVLHESELPRTLVAKDAELGRATLESWLSGLRNPSPESVAHFVYAWGGLREFAVRKEQEFSLKPEEQVRYKLVDVQSAKAVVVNTQKPNEPIEVGLLTP